MKKADLAKLLQDVKSGKVKIDDAIVKAAAGRSGLAWEETKLPSVTTMAPTYIYKTEFGKFFRLPMQKKNSAGQVMHFQPFYRTVKATKKEEVKK